MCFFSQTVDLGPTGGGAGPAPSSTALALGGGGFANKTAAKAPSKVDKSVRENSKVSIEMELKTKGAAFADFHWQSGYGAFSVSQSDADAVVAYIRDQAQHHQKMTFQDEYRRLLERYHVAFDERYVWD